MRGMKNRVQRTAFATEVRSVGKSLSQETGFVVAVRILLLRAERAGGALPTLRAL